MSINQHAPVPPERLSAVTNLLVAGHSVADAAERLGITPGQALYAERVAKRRAGVRSRADLMRAHGNADPVLPAPNRTPIDVQAAIVEKRKAGETNQAIALQYGLSESGVSRICKRWRDECVRRDEHARMARVTEQAYCDARAEERGAAE